MPPGHRKPLNGLAPHRLFLLTAITMVAFAGNSILCRFALSDTEIDPASFTLIRLVSGALMLGLLAQLNRGNKSGRGNWISAAALFGYAALFSFAYSSLSAASGALLLFVAVQVTMIAYGIRSGERLRTLQSVGLVIALAGLVGLLMPGLTAPPLEGAVMMVAAGIAWGLYSLRGRTEGDPLRVSAGNFLLAVPLAVGLSLLMLNQVNLDSAGVWLAIVSGALASGLAYPIWYTVLPSLKATNAATIQLSVPLITALGGVLLLDEHISLRLLIAGVAILGGIAIVVRAGKA